MVPDMGKVVTFYINGALCGIDILTVQEVNRITDITQVPMAPDHVRGIVNLRGRIVTVIDLGTCLSSTPSEQDILGGESRNIIVHSQGELVGLLVERVGEAIEVDWNEMMPPPGNLHGVRQGYFRGVFRRENTLIGVLDVEAVLA